MNKRLGMGLGVFAMIVGLTLMDSVDQATAGLLRGRGGYSGCGGCGGGRARHHHHRRRGGCCGQSYSPSGCAPMNGCGDNCNVPMSSPGCCGTAAPGGNYDGGPGNMQAPPPAPEASPSDAPPPPAPSAESAPRPSAPSAG